MPGRMGGNTVTVQNLEVVQVDTENSVILVKVTYLDLKRFSRNHNFNKKGNK